LSYLSNNEKPEVIFTEPSDMKADEKTNISPINHFRPKHKGWEDPLSYQKAKTRSFFVVPE
jgi:hypothetical protein